MDLWRMQPARRAAAAGYYGAGETLVASDVGESHAAVPWRDQLGGTVALFCFRERLVRACVTAPAAEVEIVHGRLCGSERFHGIVESVHVASLHCLCTAWAS